MPDNTWSDADTAATAQVVSAGINYASGANQNRKQRKWSEEQYAKQRTDALADWQMQNDYNSPAAHMKRLKAAGLNPNLVYGDGANMPASTIRSSSVEGAHTQAPQLDLGGAASSLMASVGLKNTEAQTDNLKTTNELIKQQILNTAANTQNVGQSTATSEFNLQQLKQKASTDIEQVKANLAKTYADTTFTLDQNERAAAMQAVNIKGALQNIANLKASKIQTEATTENTRQNTAASKLGMEATKQGISSAKTSQEQVKQTITNLQTDNRLKLLDEKLKQNNIQPGDPAYMRILQKLTEHMYTPKRFKKEVDNFINNLGRTGPNAVTSPLNSLP